MVPLNSYFHSLQARTGATCFTIVRDDAILPSTQSSETSGQCRCSSKTELKHSPDRLKRRSVRLAPKFEAEKLDFQPPCPPTRVDSHDDIMYKAGCKRSLSHRSTQAPPELSSRFKSLFGAEIASSIKAKQLEQPDFQRIEIKALANLAAPKFPIRRGSRDDLSTLPASRRRIHQFPRPCGTANEKIELSKFLDEVTSVLNDSDGTLQTRFRSNSDDSERFPYVAQEIENYSLSPR